VVFGAAVIASGCGGSSGGSTGGSASAPGTPSSPLASSVTVPTPSLSPSPGSEPLTAAAMKADLLPASAAPRGYRLRFQQAIRVNGQLGCGRTAVPASHEVGDDFQKGKTGAELDEVIRGYPSAAVAQRAMRQIVAFAQSCRSVSTYKLRAIPYPNVGGVVQALSVRNVYPGFGVVGRGEWVFVLKGTTILEVIALGSQAAPAANTVPVVRLAEPRIH
jgi:hypothetical protein